MLWGKAIVWFAILPSSFFDCTEIVLDDRDKVGVPARDEVRDGSLMESAKFSALDRFLPALEISPSVITSIGDSSLTNLKQKEASLTYCVE